MVARGESCCTGGADSGRDAAEEMYIYLKNKISQSLKKRMVA
jgi:hypothetical protein